MKIKSKYHYFLALAAVTVTSGQLHADITSTGDTLSAAGPTVTINDALTVNGTLLVQPAVTITNGVPSVTPGSGTPSAIGGVTAGTGGNVILTRTLIDTTTNSQVATGSGGASITTSGDEVLKAATTITSTVNYGRAVTFEVAQAGNSNPVGLAIASTAKYYLTTPAGIPVVGAPTFTTQALLDAYIATLPPATMLTTFPTLGTAVTASGAGGNLTVTGQTTTNGIDNTGKQINNLAAGTLATDAANTVQVTSGDAAVTKAFQAADNVEFDARTKADAKLTDNLATEVTNRTALIHQDADGIHIGPNSLVTLEAPIPAGFPVPAGTPVITTEQKLFAENVLGQKINIDVTNGSNLLINGKYVATQEYATAADTLERNSRIAADDQIRSDYQAADSGLRSDIDQNTRGIAMVAAMTNTTVEKGKTHGVDFNVAQFQSKTGMSFGYANRINDNLQIHAAAASTTDFDEAVARIGLSYQW